MLGGGDQLTCFDGRITAGRWLDTLSHPPIKIHQHGSLDIRDTERVTVVFGHRRCPRRRTTVGRTVCHEVTDARVKRRVLGAGRVSMDERSRARPILERVVRHDDLGDRIEAFGLDQNVAIIPPPFGQKIERADRWIDRSYMIPIQSAHGTRSNTFAATNETNDR